MSQVLFPVLALTSSFFISTSTYADQSAHLSVTSSSFGDHKDIPVVYTCDGSDVSPQIAWRGTPANAKSYALICHDPDAPSGVWYHWVLFNIPTNVTELPSGVADSGGVAGRNSWGREQYNGPCPPAQTIHRYIFTFYALDTQLSLSSGADAKAVQNAMQGHILAKTTLMGVFGH